MLTYVSSSRRKWKTNWENEYIGSHTNAKILKKLEKNANRSEVAYTKLNEWNQQEYSEDGLLN